jgi:hypothetical protein
MKWSRALENEPTSVKMLEALIEHLELAWQTGSADLNAFCGEAGLSPHDRYELALVDMECRWSGRVQAERRDSDDVAPSTQPTWPQPTWPQPTWLDYCHQWPQWFQLDHLTAKFVAFMAPEQFAAGEGITQATDVYGIGGILCSLLEQNSPGALRDSLLSDVCDKCLARDPKARFEDANAILRALA